MAFSWLHDPQCTLVVKSIVTVKHEHDDGIVSVNEVISRVTNWV